MQWRALVDGDIFDLQQLTKRTSAGGVRITHDEQQKRYVLESPHFAGMTNENAVRAEAERTLAILTGVGRLKFGTRTPLTVGAVHETRDDGTAMLYLHFHDTINVRDSVDAAVVNASGEVETSLSLREPIDVLIQTAHAAPVVEKALRLYGAGCANWVDLYRVFEVVDEDVGGLDKAAALCGVTVQKFRTFKHTANSPAAVGDLARHGASAHAPPPSPMPLDEAQSLIALLLQSWLRSKAAPPAGA